MPFVVAENPPAVMCTADILQDQQVRGLFARANEDQKVHIPRIVVGATRYPMRRPLVGTYFRALRELTVEGLSPLFIGEGDSAEAAKEDFCLKVHAAVQELIHKRPFEMTEHDKLIWNMLNEFIDVTVYRNTTPIVVRQFGKIMRTRPFPVQVAREDGRTETVTVKDVDDDDYVTYRAGQPFEAIVHRDPLTSRLMRVVHINRRSEPQRLDSGEEKQLLDEIGSTRHLHHDTQWRP